MRAIQVRCSTKSSLEANFLCVHHAVQGKEPRALDMLGVTLLAEPHPRLQYLQYLPSSLLSLALSGCLGMCCEFTDVCTGQRDIICSVILCLSPLKQGQSGHLKLG